MKIFAIAASLLALAGCAQLPQQVQGQISQIGSSIDTMFAPAGGTINTPLPVDAIAARDPDLAEAMGKIGRIAATRAQIMGVSIFARNPADLKWLADSVRAGIPKGRESRVKIQQTQEFDSRVTMAPIDSRKTLFSFGK